MTDPALGTLLTLKEASGLSHYHHKYLQRLIYEGHLPAVKRSGLWFVTAEDLIAYLQKPSKNQKPKGGRTVSKGGRPRTRYRRRRPVQKPSYYYTRLFYGLVNYYEDRLETFPAGRFIRVSFRPYDPNEPSPILR